MELDPPEINFDYFFQSKIRGLFKVAIALRTFRPRS